MPTTTLTSREQVVRAAHRCFQRSGPAGTSMEDIALEADVSRATVYRLFSGREELVLEALLWVTRRHLDRHREHYLTMPDLASALVELVTTTVAAARTDHSLGLLFSSDRRDRGRPMHEASAPLLGLYGEAVAGITEAFDGELAVDRDTAAELVLRVILSLLTFDAPRTRNAEEERRFVATFLLPALGAS